MPKAQKPPVPLITSAKQEAEFWENRSALDYDLNFSSEQLDVHPDARSVSINLRLPRWLVNDIKAIAQEEGISHQCFIRQVLIAFAESRQRQRHKPQ